MNDFVDPSFSDFSIVGIDEVGYGCWAGPIYVCALKLNCVSQTKFVDSKSISHKKRLEMSEIIKDIATWNIGIGLVEEINQFGLAYAYNKAILRALDPFTDQSSAADSLADRAIDPLADQGSIAQLVDPQVCSFQRQVSLTNDEQHDLDLLNVQNCTSFINHRLIIDGRKPKWMDELGLNCTAIIKGDQKVQAISAASIVAKVERDAFMDRLDVEFPVYGFNRNKGYGTTLHVAAIREHGFCQYHRTSYNLGKYLLK